MPERPNILFIITDQQRADTIKAWGAEYMQTPNMDLLASRGTSFRQAYCPAATCTPSRAAIFTGMYAHNTGCYSFFDWAHHRTWIQDLNDAGYWCVNQGKMHFQPRDEAGGFHERTIVENPTGVTTWGGHGDDAWGKHLTFHGEKRPVNRHRSEPNWESKFQAVPWHLEEHLHSDVFVGDSAASWIRGYADEKQPFFLQVGFPGPHEPFDPPERLLKHYAQFDPEPPASFREDLSGKPPQHTAHRQRFEECDHEARLRVADMTKEDYQKTWRHYMAKITLVDEQIGKVLDALRERGVLENTVVVFTSDHGESLGEHGLPYKWIMHDPVVRVPLIISDFREEKNATECDDLVSLIDLGPTILEYCDLPKPTRLEGQSLIPAMQGEDYARRSQVYCEDSYMIMCRSERYKLVYYIGQELGEFYDLEADPSEVNNLWNDPAAADQLNAMKLTLLEWLASSNYHNYGYKCRRSETNPQYGVRWPRPEESDFYLLGGDQKPPVVRFH